VLTSLQIKKAAGTGSLLVKTSIAPEHITGIAAAGPGCVNYSLSLERALSNPSATFKEQP
jgi:hypothetical protein